MNPEIVKIDIAEKHVGGMENIADLVSEHKLECCFKFSGYIAFVTYDEFYNDTIHSIEFVHNEIFIVDPFNSNLSEVLSGTEKIYKTVGATKALNKLPPDKKYIDVTKSGWVFLERNVVAVEQMKLALQYEGELSGFEVFDQNKIALYELKLTQKNFFISQKSLSVHLSLISRPVPSLTHSITKSTPKRDGVAAEKRLAEKRIIHIAKLTWENEINSGDKKTRLLEMATAIRNYLLLHEKKIYEQTTSNESVKNLIRCIAPDYAKLGGKPQKNDSSITVIADK